MTIEPGGGERGSAGRGPEDVDLVRTMALSSAGLWHEILERLREVQESQVRLAGAIETLGTMVRDALAPEGRPVLGAHSQRAPIAPVSGEPAATPGLSWVASASASRAPSPSPAPAAPDQEAAVSAPTEAQPTTSSTDPALPRGVDTSSGSAWTVVPDEAEGISNPPRRPRHAIGSASEGASSDSGRSATGAEPIDAFLGFKTPPPRADTLTTGVETSSPGAQSGAAEVPEPLFATEVPEPLFYAAPPDEEILPAGAVADLTPADLDAVLTAEFGVHRVQANGQSPPPPPAATPDDVAAPTVPVALVPSGLAAFDAAPVDVGPVGIAPAPAAPVETGPAETGPVETAPIGTAPMGTALTGSAVFAEAPAFAPEPTFTGAPSVGTVEAAAPPLEPPAPPAIDPAGANPAPARTASTGRANVTDPNVVLDILLGARPTPEDWQTDGGASMVTATSGLTTLPPPPPVFEAAPDQGPPAPPVTPLTPMFEAAPDPVAPVLLETPVFEAAPDLAPPAPAVTPLLEAAPDPWPTINPVFATQAPPAPTRIPEPATPLPPPVSPLPPAASTLSPCPELEPGAPQMAVPPPPPDHVPDPSAGALGTEIGSEVFTPLVHSPDVETSEVPTTGPFSSAASMATEILSVTPEIPTVAAPEEPEVEPISKDVTLIARGRRKRFRLH